MKKLLFTSIVLLFVTLSAHAQNAPRLATARIMESPSKEFSRISLVYETGESEIIPLQSIKLLGGVDGMNQAFIENQKTINKMLNNMDAKGYDLSHITQVGRKFLQYLHRLHQARVSIAKAAGPFPRAHSPTHTVVFGKSKNMKPI